MVGIPRKWKLLYAQWQTLEIPSEVRLNNHWSAPLVSARSGGPRKMSQSPVSRNSKIETNMDRPKFVVRVIRGVA